MNELILSKLEVGTLEVKNQINSNVIVQSGTAAEDLTGVTSDTVWYASTTQAGEITLPQATAFNVGMKIKLIAGANWASTAFLVGFDNAGSTVLHGYLRVGTLNAVLTTGFAVTANAKSLTIDANAVATAGGGIGSTYEFTYIAKNVVHVAANGYLTTGTVATTAAASTTTGTNA